MEVDLFGRTPLWGSASNYNNLIDIRRYSDYSKTIIGQLTAAAIAAIIALSLVSGLEIVGSLPLYLKTIGLSIANTMLAFGGASFLNQNNIYYKQEFY